MELKEITDEELMAELRRRQLDTPGATFAILEERNIHLTRLEAKETLDLLRELGGITDNLIYDRFSSKDALDKRLCHIETVMRYFSQQLDSHGTNFKNS